MQLLPQRCRRSRQLWLKLPYSLSHPFHEIPASHLAVIPGLTGNPVLFFKPQIHADTCRLQPIMNVLWVRIYPQSLGLCRGARLCALFVILSPSTLLRINSAKNLSFLTQRHKVTKKDINARVAPITLLSRLRSNKRCSVFSFICVHQRASVAPSSHSYNSYFNFRFSILRAAIGGAVIPADRRRKSMFV